MENASKALLIAGSILIAIILIATGMRVLNSTSGMTNSAQTSADTFEITNFNNKFSQLCGTNKKKSEVMALANQIIANNATNKAHIIKISVYIQEGKSNREEYEANMIVDLINYLSDNVTYTMKPQYGEDGYINMIKVY